MYKNLSNQRGMTLIELLAAIVILTIISLILFNILGFSFKTNNKQLSENRTLYDETYALKIISKDLRQSNSCAQTSEAILLNNPVKNSYTFNEGQLFRNGKIFLKTTSNPLSVIFNSNNKCIGLEVNFSESNKIVNTTTLYLRSGER